MIRFTGRAALCEQETPFQTRLWPSGPFSEAEYGTSWLAEGQRSALIMPERRSNSGVCGAAEAVEVFIQFHLRVQGGTGAT